MVSDKSKLHSKSYYTLDDLSLRWEVPVDVVEDIIFDQCLLRPAFRYGTPTRKLPMGVDQILEGGGHKEVPYQSAFIKAAQAGSPIEDKTWIYINLTSARRFLREEETGLYAVLSTNFANSDAKREIVHPVFELEDTSPVNVSCSAELGRVDGETTNKEISEIWFDILGPLIIPAEEAERYERKGKVHRSSKPDTGGRELGNREILIGLLVKYLLANIKIHSQAALVEKLGKDYSEFEGVSKSNLEKIFAAANKAIGEKAP
jgi:hypothetical protein